MDQLAERLVSIAHTNDSAHEIIFYSQKGFFCSLQKNWKTFLNLRSLNVFSFIKKTKKKKKQLQSKGSELLCRVQLKINCKVYSHHISRVNSQFSEILNLLDYT